MKKINFRDYMEACIKFREDTKDWARLDSHKWRITDWFDIEGFDILWCYGIEEDEVTERIYDEYIKNVKKNIGSVIATDYILEKDKTELEQYVEINY